MSSKENNKDYIINPTTKRLVKRSGSIGLKILSSERRSQLSSELKKVHVELRSDSKLCNGYIDGSLDNWTISQIIKRMCEMKFLYEYCDMNAAYEKAKQNFYNSRYDRYERYNTQEIFEDAERIALRRSNGYPKIFPWLVLDTIYKNINLPLEICRIISEYY
jgi:hypothetical protein